MAIGSGWADGAWVDAGWITAGNGAWVQASATKTIGATSQLGLITSTGTIAVLSPKTLGATSQLALFTATGGIDVLSPKTLGAISQLAAFTASGGLTAPTATPAVDPPGVSGGGMGGYQRNKRRKQLKALIREDEELMALVAEALPELVQKYLN